MTSALELAASGLSIDRVAMVVGADIPTTVALINTQLQEQLKLDPDEARMIEVTHLDMLRAALTPAALNGDLSAARILVNIHLAKTALLNLPARATPADEDQEGDDDLDRLRNSRAARRTATD